MPKVFARKFHFLRIACLLAGGAGALAAGDFVAPAEGPVAFRRDRVPLDAETMMKLSQQLSTLAGGLDGKTAAQRRGAAQMLALAIALDPANTRARALVEQFEKGTHEPDKDAERFEKAFTRLWSYPGWLESPEAGPDGQALASCLKDVLAVAGPEDPRSEALRTAGERGKWAGWVPDAAAYEMAKVAADPAPDPGDVPETPEKSGILLKQATVLVPLWQMVPKSQPLKWRIAASPLTMTAGEAPKQETKEHPFSLIIGKPMPNNPGGEGRLGALVPPIYKLLLQQHGQLPVGCFVRIDSKELEESMAAKRRQSVSAAAAVLASAAISGREPDATIIGQIDATGAFKLPTGFWDQLRTVRDGTGKRLILPADAAPYLNSMLAMEYPLFFMNNEVLLAANFKELLELSAKSPDEAVGKISAQFEEVRARMGNQPVGQYVANSFVRRRLVEIAQTAPYHASAKMLAIQGSGNRPITVVRPVLMAELRLAIEPMDWVIQHRDSPLLPAEVDEIGVTFETCRGEVEKLRRYSEKGERELVDRVADMVTLLRPLDRAARVRQDPDGFNNSSANLLATFTSLKQAHTAVTAELAEVPADAAQDTDR